MPQAESMSSLILHTLVCSLPRLRSAKGLTSCRYDDRDGRERDRALFAIIVTGSSESSASGDAMHALLIAAKRSMIAAKRLPSFRTRKMKQSDRICVS